jgi:carboxylesterase
MGQAWLTAVALVALALVAANAAILLLAWYEWAASPRKDPWLTSTQVLAPAGGAARSTAILLHGFGGTPRDFRPMAETLAAKGFRVVVPALPGQTSTSFAYGRGSYTAAFYRDWLESLIAEETALAGKPPALVGTSMGGTLAAIGAADSEISRAVLIAPYFSLAVGGEWTTRATALLRWILPVMPKVQKGQINDAAGYKEYQTGSYLVSLPAFLHLAELAGIARAKVPALTVPTLVFAAPKDAVASFATTERLCKGCGNARLSVCERSNHVLTYDFDRERITAETLAFLGSY